MRSLHGKLTLTIAVTCLFGVILMVGLNIWLIPRPLPPSSHRGILLPVSQLVAGTLPVLLPGGVIGVALEQMLIRPIRHLQSAARRITAGELNERIDMNRHDELGELAEVFNRMSGELARAKNLRRQMTANIAHDLRTPLTVISGHLEGLADGMLSPTPERFSVMRDEVQQLLKLVDDLHMLSLADGGDLVLYRTPTHPQEILIRAAVRHQVKAQQKQIGLQIEAGDDLPEVLIDPQRIGEVLDTLIANALRYTPPQGRINLQAWAAAGRLVIAVSDTGRGIKAADLPHIFDRFYQTDSSRQNGSSESGLGLAIARSIVLAHGGEIEAQSVPGEGATFRFYLPVGR